MVLQYTKVMQNFSINPKFTDGFFLELSRALIKRPQLLLGSFAWLGVFSIGDCVGLGGGLGFRDPAK